MEGFLDNSSSSSRKIMHVIAVGLIYYAGDKIITKNRDG